MSDLARAIELLELIEDLGFVDEDLLDEIAEFLDELETC